MSDFFCDSDVYGEPPCAGLITLRQSLADAEAKLEQAEKEREAMRLDNDGLAKIVFDQKQREAAACLDQWEKDVAVIRECDGDYRMGTAEMFADILKSKGPA